MRALPVDPRDQTSEVVAPSYRVFFWDRPTSCEEWELSEVDLDEVLAWISARADGRAHSLWAVVQRDAGVEHVRLRGVDPPAPADVWPAWAAEAR